MAGGWEEKHVGLVVVTMMEYVAQNFVYRHDDQHHGPSLVMLGSTSVSKLGTRTVKVKRRMTSVNPQVD